MNKKITIKVRKSGITTYISRLLEGDKPITESIMLLNTLRMGNLNDFEILIDNFLNQLQDQAIKGTVFSFLIMQPLFGNEIEFEDCAENRDATQKNIFPLLTKDEILFLFYHFIVRLFERNNEVFDILTETKETYIKNYIFAKYNRITYLKNVLNESDKVYENNIRRTVFNNENMKAKFDILKLDIIKDWIMLCEKTNNDNINMFFLLNNSFNDGENAYKISRENFMNHLVFSSSEETNKGLSPFFTDANNVDLLEQIIHNWYFRKYDLKTINTIYDLYKKHQKKEIDYKQKLIRGESKCITILKTFVPAVFIIILLGIDRYIYSNSGISDKSGYMIDLHLNNLPVVSSPITILQFLMLFMIGYYVVKHGDNLINHRLKSYNLLLLRLVGAIVLGYIPLIWTGDNFGFFLTTSYRVSIAICIISLIVSYIYIFLEINNGLENKISKRIVLSRAGNIFWKGFKRSSIIGLFVVDIFSRIGMTANISASDKIIGCYFNTYFGTFYLKTYAVFVVLALMLGIILQILWEENEITYPI